MQRVFKHPQIFTDLLTLSQMYYPMHHNLPKPFRYAVGERILAELAECMRLVVLANSVDKGCSQERAKGANYVRQVRAGVEVIRGWMLLGWKLKLLSHGAIAELGARLGVLLAVVRPDANAGCRPILVVKAGWIARSGPARSSSPRVGSR